MSVEKGLVQPTYKNKIIKEEAYKAVWLRKTKHTMDNCCVQNLHSILSYHLQQTTLQNWQQAFYSHFKPIINTNQVYTTRVSFYGRFHEVILKIC